MIEANFGNIKNKKQMISNHITMKDIMNEKNAISGPFGIAKAEVVELFGSKTLLERCIEAGWISPIYNQGRCCLFDREQVEQTWTRLRNGESPVNATN